MRTIVTLALVFCLVPMTRSQEVQKCCGTSSSTFLLGSTNYARHTQCLYAPDELTGATPGHITRIYYRYGVSGIANGNTLGDIRIAMVQTTATSFSNVTFLTGLQTVLDQPELTIEPGSSGDWFSIDLDTPFEFDPSRSLVVDIRFETSANTSFGTMSVTNMNGRKIMWSNTTDPSGEAWDTLQDLGFDLLSTGVGQAHPAVVSLFPNPTPGRAELELSAPLPGHAFYTVSDVTGRAVADGKVPAGSIRIPVDVEALPAGTYVLQLRDGHGLRVTRRLVRQ